MHIKNKRLDYNSSIHPSTISIDSSCMRFEHLKRDYATRASFEAQRYISGTAPHKGTLIFVLLTYNPENRPYFPNSAVPCFNRYHVSTLIRSLKDHFGRGHFSYMVGAEYGVDERFQRLPHYHCLFMLDYTLQPRVFMEYIRTIWTGEKYYEDENGKQSWKFGNLGFVFPSPKDCDIADNLRGRSDTPFKRDYVAISAASCATYAAKYAVKSIGFFRDKEVLREISKYDKCKISYMLPRAFTSQKFGFNMMQDETFDPVRGKVYDTLRQREVDIPSYILRCYMYKRVWRGREKEEIQGFQGYDRSACDRACKYDLQMKYGDNLPPVPFCVYEQYALKHLQEYPIFSDIKVTKLYDNELLTHAYPIKIMRLLERISRMQMRVSEQYGCTLQVARDYSIYSCVYRSLPSSVFQLLFGSAFIPQSDYFKESTFVSVYLYCYLYKNLSFPRFKCGTFAQDCLLPSYANLFATLDLCEQLRGEYVLLADYEKAVKLAKSQQAEQMIKHGSCDSSLLINIEKPSTPLIDYKKYVVDLDFCSKLSNIANELNN